VKVFDLLKKPFIIDWYASYALAHGDYDYEHYEVIWYDPKTRSKKTNICCNAGCGNVPFNVETEIDKFDDMGKKAYWISYGVPEEFITTRRQT